VFSYYACAQSSKPNYTYTFPAYGAGDDSIALDGVTWSGRYAADPGTTTITVTVPGESPATLTAHSSLDFRHVWSAAGVTPGSQAWTLGLLRKTEVTFSTLPDTGTVRCDTMGRYLTRETRETSPCVGLVVPPPTARNSLLRR
jgi:hypothetical protein